MRQVVIVLSMIVITSCTIGQTGKDLALLHKPGGAQITWVAAAPGAGELVAVRPEGLIVNSQNRLLLVQLSSIRRLRVQEPGLQIEIRNAAELTPRNLESLRLISRFPQGLTPEIEKKFLGQLGRTAVDTIK